MFVANPRLPLVNNFQSMELNVTHPNHAGSQRESFINQGRLISEISKTVGAEAVQRTGTFQDAMLQALDKVSAHQQFASSMHEAAIIDPDSVDIHDITIAQAQASMSLNITRNVLNRVVQAWRDLINTR